jgi:hypothetical protein
MVPEVRSINRLLRETFGNYTMAYLGAGGMCVVAALMVMG